MNASRSGLGSIPTVGEAARQITSYWWLWLVAGIAWLVISAAILQFDQASITTIGILVGILFAFLSVQNLVFATAPSEAYQAAGISDAWRWVSGLFAFFFLLAAIASFISPENTFAGLADMLGFLFLLVGFWWIIRAFLERPLNPSWWLGLIAGILMTVLAFWTAGQFFTHKAYILLVFAGIWALMEGIVDIVRAFEIREVNKALTKNE